MARGTLHVAAESSPACHPVSHRPAPESLPCTPHSLFARGVLKVSRLMSWKRHNADFAVSCGTYSEVLEGACRLKQDTNASSTVQAMLFLPDHETTAVKQPGSC